MLSYTAHITGGALTTEGFDADEKKYAKLAEWVPLSRIPDVKPILEGVIAKTLRV